MYKNIDQVKLRLHRLKITKDLKKEIYKKFPSTKTYKDIIEIISEIKYLEKRIKNFNKYKI